MFRTRKLSTAFEGISNTARPVRVPAPQLEVVYSIGVVQKQVRIKNISPTGIYLLTADRWPPGSTVLLTLKRRTGRKKESGNHVIIPAKTVRHDTDGAGMEFLHEGLNTADWLALFSRAVSMTLNNDPVRVFRMTKALAFLRRITSLPEPRVSDLFKGLMNRDRIERAIGIVLAAEALLDSRESAPRTDLSSVHLRQILEEGSRHGDGLAERFWAGLLASASLDHRVDDTGAAFADLLSELAPIHIHILDAAASRAVGAGWKTGHVLREELRCSIEEIKEISGREELTEIEAALDYLHALGLMQLTLRVFEFVGANLTPTRLGLSLYARCMGETDLSPAIQSTEGQHGYWPTPFEPGLDYSEEQLAKPLHRLNSWNPANALAPRSVFEDALAGNLSGIQDGPNRNGSQKLNVTKRNQGSAQFLSTS